MKKAFLLLFTAVLLLNFAACGKGTQEAKAVDLAAIMADISANAAMPAETYTYESIDDLSEEYGIPAEQIKSFAVTVNATGYEDEIVMLEATDEAAANSIKALLEDKLQADIETMRDYAPAQYQILLGCKVNINGVYISLFVSSDAAKMIEIYNSYFA